MHCSVCEGRGAGDQSVSGIYDTYSFYEIKKKTAEVEDSSCQTSLPVPSASAGPFLQQ